MGDNSWELHLRLITHINGQLHPSLDGTWRKFTGMIGCHLGRSTINKFKDFTQVAEELMERSLIAVGRYNLLSEIFGTIQLIQLQNHVITSQKEILDALKREGKEPSTGPPETDNTDDRNKALKESSTLVTRMVNHAAEVLSPSVQDLWRRFTDSYISYYFSEKEMEMCKGFEDVFDMLMRKNFIAIGNYEFLTRVLHSIDLIQLKEEVEKFEKQIKAALAKETNVPKAAGNDSSAVNVPDSLRLQYEMMKHIDGAVSPQLSNWNKFMMFIGRYLERAEKAQCKGFADVFNKLMGKRKIRLGQYDVLVQIFNDIELIKLKTEVEDYQKRIKDAIEQEGKEKQAQEKEKPQARVLPQTQERNQTTEKVEKTENTPRKLEFMDEAADDCDEEEELDLK